MATLSASSRICAVIPHHGSAELLAAAVESLLLQTRPPDAIVIVDDASPALPHGISEQFPETTLLVAGERSGPFRLVQSVIDSTDFDAYLFQDSDDVSHPDRLRRLLETAERSNADVVGSDVAEIDIVSPEVRRRHYPVDASAALLANPIAFALLHPTSLVTRRAVLRAGGFPGGLRFGGDVDFLWRVAHVSRIVNVASPLYVRRRRPGSLSTSAETGEKSSARRALDHALRERARRNAERAAAGEALDLTPYASAPPVGLRHISGPVLGSRRDSGARDEGSVLPSRGRATSVLVGGGPRAGADVLACALSHHPAIHRGGVPLSVHAIGSRDFVERLSEEPDALAILVCRDVESTVESLATRPDTQDDYYGPSSALAAATGASRAMAALHRLLEPDRVLEVEMADISTSPEEVLKRCTDFLQLPESRLCLHPLVGLSPRGVRRSEPTPLDALESQRLLAELPDDSNTRLAGRLRSLVHANGLAQDSTIAVISRGDDTLLDLPAGGVWHFPRTKDGAYAGEYPGDGAQAVQLLEAIKNDGATHLLVPAPSAWWLDHYFELRAHLHREYRVAGAAPDTGVLYDLTEGASEDASAAATVRFVHDDSVPIEMHGMFVGEHIIETIRKLGDFYEMDLLAHLARTAPRGGVYIDVGANIGNHTVYFGKFLAERVISIEPDETLLPLLTRNVTANAVDAMIIAGAAGSRPGRGQLFHPAGFESNAGAARVQRDDSAAPAGGVEIVVLDEVVDALRQADPALGVSLLKIDVEGMELDVLQGATRLLARDHPDVVVEAATVRSHEVMIEFMSRAGYREVGVFCHTPTYHFQSSHRRNRAHEGD